MEKEFSKYINAIDLESLLGNNQLVSILETVFIDAYKLGQKNLIDNNPLADLWNNPEDDKWNEVYAKQLAEGKLTKINK